MLCGRFYVERYSAGASFWDDRKRHRSAGADCRRSAALGLAGGLSGGAAGSGDRRDRSSGQGPADRAGKRGRIREATQRKNNRSRLERRLFDGGDFAWANRNRIRGVLSVSARRAGMSAALGVGAIDFELFFIAIGALIIIAIVYAVMNYIDLF